jgi:hypothetical protein
VKLQKEYFPPLYEQGFTVNGGIDGRLTGNRKKYFLGGKWQLRCLPMPGPLALLVA